MSIRDRRLRILFIQFGAIALSMISVAVVWIMCLSAGAPGIAYALRSSYDDLIRPIIERHPVLGAAERLPSSLVAALVLALSMAGQAVLK